MGNAISSNTTQCIALWLFDDDVIDRMAYGHTLTEVATGFISYNATSKEGTKSIEFDNQPHATAHLTIEDSALQDVFIGKDGELPGRSWSLGLWFRPTDSVGFTRNQALVAKWDTTGAARCFYVFINTNGCTRFGIASNNGASGQAIVITADAIVKDTWYHIHLQYSSATHVFSQDLWNGATSAIMGSANDVANSPQSTTSAAFSVGIMDLAAAGSASNSFTGLIDELYVMRNRLTASELLSIRQGSYAPTHNIFSNSGTCKALWTFEGNIEDKLSTNHFTALFTTSDITIDTGVRIRGNSSIYLDNVAADNSACLAIQNANLAADFPSKASLGAVDCTMMGWFKIGKTASNPYKTLIGKYHSITAGRSMLLQIITSNKTRMVWGTNSGASTILQLSSTVLTKGNWYHICIGYKAVGTLVRLKVHDSSGGVVSNLESSLGTSWYVGTASFGLGIVNHTSSNPYGGYVDEFAVFDAYLSCADITSIVADTYGAASGGGSGSILDFSLGLSISRKLQT